MEYRHIKGSVIFVSIASGNAHNFHSTIKIKNEDGQIFTFQNVTVPNQVATAFHVGSKGRFLFVKSSENYKCVAFKNSGTCLHIFGQSYYRLWKIVTLLACLPALLYVLYATFGDLPKQVLAGILIVNLGLWLSAITVAYIAEELRRAKGLCGELGFTLEH